MKRLLNGFLNLYLYASLSLHGIYIAYGVGGLYTIASQLIDCQCTYQVTRHSF